MALIAGISTTTGGVQNVHVNPSGEMLVSTTGPGTTSGESFSGNTSATPTTVTTLTFAATSNSISVLNNGSAGILEVSFDAGTSYLPLSPSQSVDIDIAIASLKLKSTLTASVPYVVLVGE